jgi:UDPglucose--hexose-1-phosphate uridylyltransferase
MNHFSATDHPHRRRNALTGEWVLVSPHRNKRPWQGQVEKLPLDTRPSYDPTCYLCPGNERAGGAKNPDYTETFVFTNDFAALLPDTPDYKNDDSLFTMQSVKGTSRVLCFSPRHDLSLAEMSQVEIRKVVEMWSDQVAELEQTYAWVQVFESKGEIIGTSNPHPHGQVWASDFLPYQPSREDAEQRRYFEQHKTPLLGDYLEHELSSNERIVSSNDHWVALVPYWAYWPFEIMILPRRHVLRIPDLSNDERTALADILRRMLTRYDNLFETSFPYRSGWHAAPSANFYEGDSNHWQLHAHYYPPLLRSATVQKFLASYEWLAEMQRDLTPEQAAERLRGLSEVHYKHR